jgi:hypothetical protein
MPQPNILHFNPNKNHPNAEQCKYHQCRKPKCKTPLVAVFISPQRNRAQRDNVIYHPKKKAKAETGKVSSLPQTKASGPDNRPSRNLYTLVLVLQEV